VTRKLTVVVGLIVLACGACASRASTPTGVDPQLDTAAVELVTASGDYPARARLLRLAEEELVRRCMSEQGQTYWPVVPAPLAGSDDERSVDLAGRRVHGYGLTDRPAAPPHVGPDEGKPEFERALFGDTDHYRQLRLPDGAELSYPTTGCVAEARAALYGDDTRWARTDAIPQVLGNALRAAPESPALTGAKSRWATCMAAAGYPYADERAAIDALTAAKRTTPTSVLRTREIAVAVADGQCALQAHVPSTELASLRSHARSLPAAQRREIVELTAVHCAATDRARSVMGPAATFPPCPARTEG
jgi:hypothetical protein